MATWTSDELNRIGRAGELRIASMRMDGSLRKLVTIWVVRIGDDLYVRSVNGPDASWFRGVQTRHEGHIRSGGVDKDVLFVVVEGDTALHQQVDAAYRTKYGYPSGPVDHITSDAARAATIKLVPR